MRQLCVLSCLLLLSACLPPAEAKFSLDDFFDPLATQEIDLQIESSDLARMFSALPERIFVPATFHWQGLTIDNVGVRFKGNSSSSPNQPHKRSFLIKFNEFTKGERFLGLRRVALDNGIQFGSLFSERLITDILRKEGVPTFRANYATLTINGEYQGVYVNTERIDKSYLENNFADPSGNLYDCDEGGPGANLAFLGENPDLYRSAFEIKNNKKTADFRDLRDLIFLINSTPLEQFKEALRNNFAIEPFLRTMAIMMLSGAFDQMTGFQPHNYYLYFDPQTNLWNYLPYD